MSVSPALVAQISDPREIGIRTGILFFFTAIGALIGNPIAGALVTRYNGGFTGLQIFTGVVFFVGTIIFVITRFVLEKRLLVKV